MQNKIAIMGNSNSILLFKAVGVDAYFSKNVIDAEKMLKNLAQSYSIIFVADELAENLKSLLTTYKSLAYPIIVPLPTKDTKKSVGIEKIKNTMRELIGTNAIKDE